jgi:glycosyltransferase involved in cell wall biosynthesis
MTEFFDAIIPIFNGEKYLSDAISSILNQTYPNLKLTILDNCSSDKTPIICQKFVKQDKRVHYIRNNENIGAINNYNKAVSLATSEFLLILSCDDYIEPKMFALGLKYFHLYPELNMILFNPRNVDANGKPLRVSRYFNKEKKTGWLTKEDFKLNFNVSPSSTLYRAPYETFDTNYSFCFDLELACRKLNNNAKILYLNIPYVNYRNHKGQNINNFKFQTKMREILRVFYKYFRHTLHFNQLISKKFPYFVKECIFSDAYETALLYLFISIRLSIKNVKEIYFWKYLILIIKNSIIKRVQIAKKIELQMRKMRFLGRIISFLDS